MQSLKTLSWRFIERFMHAGTTEQTDIETVRRISVLNLFALVGFSISFLLGVQAILSQDIWLALALFTAFALFLFAHIQLRIKRNQSAFLFAARLVQLVLFVLCLYLVYAGGANQTGPLWVYLLPPVVMFLSGLKRGMMITALFVLGYLIIVFFPGNALGAVDYSYEFKTRLLYSFLTLTFLAAVYEQSRQSSYQKLNELKQDFERQASQDTLTHLLNRRGMRERIRYEVRRSQRNNQPITFILADLDHFKEINDHYGHDTGDTVLIQVSQLLQDSVRQQDSIARWGGEEFLFLLPETNARQAMQLAEKIRSIIESHPLNSDQPPLTTTMSFGIAEMLDLENHQSTIAEADNRLYQAKSQGRNCVVGPEAENSVQSPV
ncbi:GGDEF domain-containing protein [Reinekea blandensis]|uniref:diguanylate cyclase n=1 Tax=Reinekea blandensis MED297 TaxID=314283 RepID=A4BG19_9GAMM|nr:GGDEF domain-containing protein [Reinekea blandensis]EAR09037.1 GGDEF domain protein [Reinekea sp. MED297] [Reinekea blandensis MED297]